MIFKHGKLIKNLLPAGSDNFLTNWAASSGAVVTVSKQTNMLTANQSTVETDITGFSAKNSATLTRDTTAFWQGTASLKVVTSATVPSGVNIEFDTVPLGVTCTFSAYIKGNAGGEVASIGIWCYDSAWNPLPYISVPITLTAAFARYSATLFIPANTVYCQLTVYNTTATAITYFVDGLLLEQASTPSPWNQGGFQDPFGGYNSYRIQSTGGTAYIFYSCPSAYQVPNGLQQTVDCWMKSNIANLPALGDNIASTRSTGAWSKVQRTVTMDGVTNASLYFVNDVIGNPQDFLVMFPMVEQAAIADSYVAPGSARRVWR